MRQRVVVLCFVSFGCAAKQVVMEKTPAPPPAVTFRDIKAAEVSLRAAGFNAELAVTNRAKKPLSLSSVKWKAGFDGKQLPAGEQTLSDTLEPGAGSVVSIPIQVAFGSTDDEVLQALKKKFGRIKIAGTVEGFCAGEPVAAPFEAAKEIPLPLVPSGYVMTAQAARYGPEQMEVIFEIAIGNQNKFSLRSQGFSYEILINGRKFEDGEFGVDERVLGSSDLTVEENIKLEKARHGDEVAQWIKGGKIFYEIRGTLLIDGFTLPVEHRGEINLPK